MSIESMLMTLLLLGGSPILLFGAILIGGFIILICKWAVDELRNTWETHVVG